MPLNVIHAYKYEEPWPQTLEAAYSRFIGEAFDEPDWDKYEQAVDKILRGTVPVNGHHPDCRFGRFPMGLADSFNDVEDGIIVVRCRHCRYIISRMQPDATKVVAR